MDILDANFGIMGMPGPKISSENKITLLCIFGFIENHVFDLKRTHLRVDPTHKDNVRIDWNTGKTPVKLFKRPIAKPARDLVRWIKPSMHGQRSVSFELLDLEFDRSCEGHRWRVVFQFAAWNNQLEQFQYRYWALPEDILIVGKSETEQKVDDMTKDFAHMKHISNSYFDGMQQMDALNKKLQNEAQKLERQLAGETAVALTSVRAQQSANTKSQLVIACQEASEEAEDEGNTSFHTRATAGIVKSQINCNGKRVVQRTPMECIAKKMRAT